MQLIGMLDSPYVRRVAAAMLTAGVRFEHKPISLFRHIDAFSRVSPLLKAPSLIAEGGAALDGAGVDADFFDPVEVERDAAVGGEFAAVEGDGRRCYRVRCGGIVFYSHHTLQLEPK